MRYKLKNAAKQICVLTISGIFVNNVVFAASLSNYPENLVKDGKFIGSVVVGEDAQIIDTNAATSLIDDLKNDFAQDSVKYVVSWREEVNERSIDVLADDLNYGESVGSNAEIVFDDSDTSALDSEYFRNDIENAKYTQEIVLDGGEFNYKFDRDFNDEISEGLFYENGDVFLTYTLEFQDEIDLTVSNSEDKLEGEEITIMDKNFVVSEVTESSNTIESITLLSESNSVSMYDGEVLSVTIENKDYEVELLQVAEEQILVSVNGITEVIKENDNEEVAGINVVVTEVFEKEDIGRSHAELILGGKKIRLEENSIKVNGDDLSDLDEYDMYDVDVSFNDGAGNEFKGFTITYETDDEILLEKGDVLIDPLFGSFSILYKGSNEPDFVFLEISSSDEIISFEGELEDGNDIPDVLQLFDADENAAGSTMFIGADDVRIFTSESIPLTGVMPVGLADDIDPSSKGVIEFNLSNQDVEGYAFLVTTEDHDEQYLYSIGEPNDDGEVDIRDLFEDSYVERDVENDVDDWDGALDELDEEQLSNTAVSGSMQVDLSSEDAIVALDGGMLLNLSGIEVLDMQATSPVFTLFLDRDESRFEEDVEGDAKLFEITVHESSDVSSNNDDLGLVLDTSVFENKEDAELDHDSDDKIYVDRYGTKIYANENSDNIVYRLLFEIPDEQVKGDVVLNFGYYELRSETFTSEEDAEEMISELEGDGIEADLKEISMEAVEFDVSGVVLDSEIEGDMGDMIVIGGPAVNKVAAELLNVDYPLYGRDSGIYEDGFVIQYYASTNSILIYGYEGKDTLAGVEKINNEKLSGYEVFSK